MAPDGRLPGEHLVDHGAERVDVAARIERAVAGGLFRAHVLRCAEGEARLREAVPSGLLHGERDAEVREHRFAVLQHDVLGLDVAVDHPLAVRVVERSRHLTGDVDRFTQAELAFGAQPVAQRLAGT